MSSFLTSIEDFAKFTEKMEGKFRAVVRAEVLNYANVGMHNRDLYPQFGVTGDIVPVEIPPGTKVGFTVRQNKPGKGVQMAGSWKVRDGPVAAFLSEAWQAAAWREINAPNKLGVRLLNRSPYAASYGTWSNNVTPKKFSHDLKQVKECSDKFCILGVMGNSHHCNVTIKVFPRCIEDLAYPPANDADYIYYQRELNAIIGEESSSFCNTKLPKTSTTKSTTPPYAKTQRYGTNAWQRNWY